MTWASALAQIDAAWRGGGVDALLDQLVGRGAVVEAEVAPVGGYDGGPENSGLKNDSAPLPYQSGYQR